MLYSERQNGSSIKSSFFVVKTLIGNLLMRYFREPDRFDPYARGYSRNEVEFYFLKITKKEFLNPRNFTSSVNTNGDLFDIVECAIHFLYEKYQKDPDSRRYPHMRDSAEYSKFINEVRCVLEDYGYTIRQGIIEKLPDNGMVGLTEEKIQTTEPERFEVKIEEAKRLFFDRNGNLETKKGACAMLAGVAEYFRGELRETELNKDVSELMNYVNDMDIRHNKKGKRLLDQQNKHDVYFVEWVFYSLLNCINFYLKTNK